MGRVCGFWYWRQQMGGAYAASKMGHSSRYKPKPFSTNAAQNVSLRIEWQRKWGL